MKRLETGTTFLSSHQENWANEMAIVENYSAMVIKLVSLSKPKNMDERREFIQIGYLALLEANRLFDPSRKIKFSSYAWVAIRNQLNRYKVQQEKHNHKVLTKDILAKSLIINPFESVNVSKVQENILRLKLEGNTFREIASRLNLKLGYVYDEYIKVKNQYKPISSKSTSRKK